MRKPSVPEIVSASIWSAAAVGVVLAVWILEMYLVDILALVLASSLALSSLKGRRHRRAVSWSLVSVVIVVLRVGAMAFAHVQADIVIRACEAYRVSNGEYPNRLEDLVPQWLPKVPHPRIGFLRDKATLRFIYRSPAKNLINHHAVLSYLAEPPARFVSYDFEEKRWE